MESSSPNSPQSFEPTGSFESPEPLEDVRTIQLVGTGRYRGQRNYQVPTGGLTLPATIILPEDLVRRSREDITQFGQEIGLAIPSSLTRVDAVQRIRDRLVNLGYRINPNNRNILTGGPVRIIPPEPTQTAEPTLPQPDIELPENIPGSVFRTIQSIREFIQNHHLDTFISIGRGRLKNDYLNDLQNFLLESGYHAADNGDYVRAKQFTLRGGYTLEQLLTPEEAIRVLGETTIISIQPDDLIDLNTSLHRFRGNLLAKRWSSLEVLAQELARAPSMAPFKRPLTRSSARISPELIKIAVVLDYLATFSQANLSKLLKTMGEPLNERKRGMARIYELVRPRLQLVTRTLQERIPSQGPAPSTVTLAEAIEDGYTFTYDQYEEEILDFLNYHRIPQAQLDSFVKLIQYYPEFFQLTRMFQSGSTLAYQIIKTYYDRDPSYFQILYAYVVNYPLDIAESPEMVARRNQLMMLPGRYLETIYSIYRTRDPDDILTKPVHPLELYVFAIQKAKIEHLRDLVAGFGMLVPEHIINRLIRQMILQNIPDYTEVITRSADIRSIDQAITQQPNSPEQLQELLSRYTDFEISQRFGYTGGFENRRHLINNIYESLTEEGFMLLNDYEPSLTVNDHTTLLTSLQDLPRPYLVYGTPFQYRVVELDELIHSFRTENGTIVFQHITGNEYTAYTMSQVTRLQSILPSVKTVNPELSTLVDQLMERIRQGILGNLRRSIEVEQFISILNGLSPDLRETVRDLFFKIFYAGMYMRRWLGPGNRYPVRMAQTRTGSNPEPRAILALGKVSDTLNLIEQDEPSLVDRIRRITMVDYRDDGNIIFQPHSLFRTIGQIADGQECIRVGSRGLVLTAYYYLGVCFNEIIPDFDPGDVESIA